MPDTKLQKIIKSNENPISNKTEKLLTEIARKKSPHPYWMLKYIWKFLWLSRNPDAVKVDSLISLFDGNREVVQALMLDAGLEIEDFDDKEPQERRRIWYVIGYAVGLMLKGGAAAIGAAIGKKLI